MLEEVKMQGHYACDIGDFAKFGLLRQLKSDGARLGVAWYHASDKKKKDGDKIDYIGNPEYQRCDPRLHDKFEELIGSGKRSISSLEKSGLLGQDTLYHNALLDFRDLNNRMKEWGRLRQERRDLWFKECVAETKNADFVYFDPDDGLERKSRVPTDYEGPKSLYWADLRPFVERKQSLVIYCHQNRERGTTKYTQLSQRLEQLKDRVPYGSNAFGMLWSKVAVRYFLVVPTDELSAHFRAICKAMDNEKKGWGQPNFFELREE